MAAWSAQLAALNGKVQQTFAPTDASGNPDPALYAPSSGTPAPFPIMLLQLDPLRLEPGNPGNFAMYWAIEDDFTAVGCAPAQGDVITIDGADYMVEQIQNDAGNGIRLMVERNPL